MYVGRDAVSAVQKGHCLLASFRPPLAAGAVTVLVHLPYTTAENVQDEMPQPIALQKTWERDYPHVLGMDGERSLLWRLPETQRQWHRCMRKLADVYLEIRLPVSFSRRQSYYAPGRHLLRVSQLPIIR